MSYMTQKQLIGSRQAAERLGIPTSTFYKRVKDGMIPFTVKMPGKTAAYLFDPDVIDQIEQAEQDKTGELHTDNPARYRSEGAA